THVARDGDTIFQRDAFDGDEGHDVGSADARMRAGVLREINEFGGAADAANGCLSDSVTLADQGDDAAVVVGVHFAVQQKNAGHFHGGDKRVNLGGIAAFRKIGNALDKRL